MNRPRVLILGIALLLLGAALLVLQRSQSSLAMPKQSPLLSSAFAQADETAPATLVVRAYFDDPALVAELASWLEPWQVDYSKGMLVVGVSADQLPLLEEMGFRLEIDQELTAQAALAGTPLPGQLNGIPGFPCYRTVEETYAAAMYLAFTNPQLAEWIDIGDSWEKFAHVGGYDLRVLRLTNEAISTSKPALLITASIHAREYTPAELATRFAEYLVANYGIDADVTWLLDYHEIHLMLQSNPDGRKRAETGLSWRKNADNNYCSNTDSRGADLNRNFEFQWGCCGGSSGSPCAETYRGPSPASEPETMAVQAYLRSIFPDQRGGGLTDPAPTNATGVYLDIHSYSQLVLWPWGFTYDLAPNNTALQTLGRKFAYFNSYSPSQAIDLYPTDGTTDDFGYGDLGVASYTFELGTSFFESCGVFENEILPDNLDALLYAAKAARTPYMTPAGPDALNLALSASAVAPGELVTLTAVLNDTRFNNSNGTEPVQNIAAAEMYIDVPPWDTDSSPVAIPLSPADGAFNNPVESAQITLDTSALAQGRHILFVRGRDASNHWGAFSAVFLYIIDPAIAPQVRGQVVAADTNLPLAAAVDAGGVFNTDSDPASGFYQMYALSGAYDLTASPLASGYAPATAQNVELVDGQVTVQDFQLMPYCTAFSDDVESGNIGWTVQAPWAITTESAHSPTHSWTDSPGGSYGNYRNAAITSPVIDLSGYSDISLNFWQICSTESGWDYCRVEVSNNGGASYTELAAYDGHSTTWEEITLPASLLDGAADARIRFRFTSDSNTVDDGWHLDDIRLLGTGAGCITLQPPEAGFAASASLALGETAIFTNTSTGSLLSFAWDFGDGSPPSTERNPQHVYAAGGTYTVSLTASNSLGSDTFSQQVEVIAPAAPDFNAWKAASTGSVLPGETIAYTLTFQLDFSGAHTLTHSISDTLPAGVILLTDTLRVNGAPMPEIYDPVLHALAYQTERSFDNFSLVVVAYSVRVTNQPAGGETLVNSASFRFSGEGYDQLLQVTSEVLVPDYQPLYLPLLGGSNESSRPAPPG